MRLVPILFPCDLGATERGVYRQGGERSAPDLLLDLLEEEGVRMARPELVAVPAPEGPEPEDAPLKYDAQVTGALLALSEVVAGVNANGDFPLVLGGDHLALCGQVLGHSSRHPDGIGLAVLADAHLDLAAPARPVFEDEAALRSDPAVTRDGDARHMVLAGALRLLEEDTAFGKVMARSTVQSRQTSVLGVRTKGSAQIAANARRASIEVWPLERLEFDGEAAYRSMLNRHLAQGPIALSIDVTGLDPHLMTAVREPIPDGLDWSFLKRTLEQCVPHIDRILGLDICQVDPTKDDVHHSATVRLVEAITPFLKRLTR